MLPYSPPVYQALLTRRYLTSKVMPLLASLAVMLCTTMVLVTWSVMGGFLKVLLESGRKLVGDVKIEWPNVGFAYSEELRKQLESDSGFVIASTPIIETFGQLGLPGNKSASVIVKGIDPASFDKVTGYYDTIWWRPINTPLPKDTEKRDPRLKDHDIFTMTLDNGKKMERSLAGSEPKPAAVLGTEVSGRNLRMPEGFYVFGSTLVRNPDGSMPINTDILPLDGKVTLSLPRLDSSGQLVEMKSHIFPVANEFKTDVYMFDSKVVLVPITALQEMIRMDAAKRIEATNGQIRIVKDPVTGQEKIERPTETKLVEDPARVTGVLVRGTEGKSLKELHAYCERAYAAFAAKHPGKVPPVERMVIQTWEEQNAGFIGAVQHEIGLVLFLFSIISLVAVVLVLSIFWSMVSEKTKDIGILRAIGASRIGIAWLWLRYGLAIGVVGSALGLGVSWLVISNINEIHEWLGRSLGIQVWDPSVYYFTRIPSDLNWMKVAIVLSGGVIFSVLGSLLPAIRAARMDPVQSLRFE